MMPAETTFDPAATARRERGDSRAPELDRLPPHDDAAERAVIGCCLGGTLLELDKTPALIERCCQQFGSDEVFYDLRHQTIWHAIVFLKNRDGKLDLITLQAELSARGMLDQVGGVAYLAECQDKPFVHNFELYLGIVWEKFVARQLLQRNSRQTEAVMQSGELTESKIADIQQRHEEWVKLLQRGSIQPKNLSQVNAFDEAVYHQFFERKEDTFGWALPFEYTLRLRPAETTLFTGDNGSGKTSMLSLIAVAVAKQLPEGERVVVASMEMRPEVTLWIMCRQLMGLPASPERTPENISKLVKALAWLNQRVLLYNFWGITDKHDLLNTFHYAAEQHNGRFFIIDNMMKVGIADDDYAAQGLFIQNVTAFSMKHKAHTIVVVHENKGDGNTKQKVRGSKQLTDAVDNVCKMERNEKKAQKLDELKSELRAGLITKEEFNSKRAGMGKEWDSKFTHSKQRYPGTNQNGSRWLYFHHDSLQFHEEPHQGAIDFTQ
jgi:KaiC/GvpD/RAD55 family RecA-like ATPase